MSMRALSLVIAFAAGEPMNVAAVCREVRLSRKSFYKYVARYRAEGLAGLEQHSRRPHSSPRATPVEIEDAIVELRKQLCDAGHDHGATTIHWHLCQDNRFKRAVPSIATVPRSGVKGPPAPPLGESPKRTARDSDPHTGRAERVEDQEVRCKEDRDAADQPHTVDARCEGTVGRNEQEQHGRHPCRGITRGLGS